MKTLTLALLVALAVPTFAEATDAPRWVRLEMQRALQGNPLFFGDPGFYCSREEQAPFHDPETDLAAFVYHRCNFFINRAEGQELGFHVTDVWHRILRADPRHRATLYVDSRFLPTWVLSPWRPVPDAECALWWYCPAGQKELGR